MAGEERRLRNQISDREESARFHAQGFHRPVAGLVLIEPPTPAPPPPLKRTGSFKGGKKGRGKSKSSDARTPTPVPPVLEEEAGSVGPVVEPTVKTVVETVVEPHVQVEAQVDALVEGGLDASMDEVQVNGLGGHDEDVVVAMDLDEQPVVVHSNGLVQGPG